MTEIATAADVFGANPIRNDELDDPKKLARMVHLLDPKPHEDICDVGAGKGKPAVKLAKRARKVIAFDVVDLCRAALEECNRELGWRCVEFRCADISRGCIPLADLTVDIVLCRAVLHHLEDKNAFFANAFRVLRPGGRLYIMDPLMSPDLRFAWSIISKIAEADYRSYCTREELFGGVTRAGFDLDYEGHFLFRRSLREWIDGKIMQVDTSGAKTDTAFARHVRHTIWDVVMNDFPVVFQEELHLMKGTAEGWFCYNCVELVAVKPANKGPHASP